MNIYVLLLDEVDDKLRVHDKPKVVGAFQARDMNVARKYALRYLFENDHVDMVENEYFWEEADDDEYFGYRNVHSRMILFVNDLPEYYLLETTEL